MVYKFHGKAYEQMDDLGVPLFLDTSILRIFQPFWRVISDGWITYVEVMDGLRTNVTRAIKKHQIPRHRAKAPGASAVIPSEVPSESRSS